MLCALTVRKLKPWTFEDFKAAFVPAEDLEAPAGWKGFYALRNVNDENEVITFGLFDGTLDELRAGQEQGEYDQRRPPPTSPSSRSAPTASTRWSKSARWSERGRLSVSRVEHL